MEQKAFELIEQMAAKLGVAVQFVMSALIRQAYVEAITWVVVDLLFIVVSVFIFRNIRKIVKWCYGEDDDLRTEAAILMVPAIIYIVCMLVCLCHIETIVTGFLNPEYWAIKQILDLAK